VGESHEVNGGDGTGYSKAAGRAGAAERINPSYVARLLWLIRLAPDIVEDVLSGRTHPGSILIG
jgi:hypothetical protein